MEEGAYAALKDELRLHPKRWLVTGAAGFIGSHLAEQLLLLDQEVVGLDNFATGYRANLENVCSRVSLRQKERFLFIEGDITEPGKCAEAANGCDIVLHQAALGSVPRSVKDPAASHRANVDGFVNMILAARDAGVRRFVYASSSSVYGDSPVLPKVEEQIGRPLSPYAATKQIDELYAGVFSGLYEIEPVGLRYFNVFGPRQDPNGAYAAVIPRWIFALKNGQSCTIYGDGETSRDFCYVANVVQANLLAAAASREQVSGRAFNVAVGERTTLRELYDLIVQALSEIFPGKMFPAPEFAEFRLGDVRHSLATIDKSRASFGYQPKVNISQGLKETVRWFTSD